MKRYRGWFAVALLVLTGCAGTGGMMSPDERMQAAVDQYNWCARYVEPIEPDALECMRAAHRDHTQAYIDKYGEAP